MKECERVNDLFGELYDRGIDHEVETSLREHLNCCTCCREEFKWYGLTVQVLADLERISPPNDFLRQVRTRLYTPPPGFSFRVFFSSVFSSAPYMPLPIGVTALAFVVVVGFVMYNHMPYTGASGAAPVAVQAPASSARSGPESRLSAWDMRGNAEVPWRNQIPGRPLHDTPTGSSASYPQYVMSPPQQIEKALPRGEFRTVADLIGADNLTVESPSPERAVESLKRMLPDIHGQLVAEKPRTPREWILGIVIPSKAYGPLTTELINHGNVAVGAGSETDPPPPTPKDDNNVLLHIRFINSR